MTEQQDPNVAGQPRFWTLRVPLPVTSNHMYKAITIAGHQSKALAPEYKAWRENVQPYVAVQLAGLPRRTRLEVIISLGVPANLLRRCDIDGYVKPLLDLLGSRQDQYVDVLHVQKDSGDGWATMSVWIRVEGSDDNE